MAKDIDKRRDAALFADLDEATLRLLYPERFDDPFTVTFVYEPLTGEAANRALELMLAGTVERAPDPSRPGSPPVDRVTFDLTAIESMHALLELLDEQRGPDEVEILVSGRRVPLVRELWLPLLWNLRA